MIHFLASLAFLRSSVITGELRWSSAARASGQSILQEGSQRCPAISPGSRELKGLCSISVDLGAPGKCPVSSPRMSIDEKKQLWFHQLRSACMRFDDRSLGLIPRSCTLHFRPYLRRWPTEHAPSDHSRTDRVRKVMYSHMQSVGRIYIIWPSCVEGPGGCPTPPQAEPLQNTHLLGVPA